MSTPTKTERNNEIVRRSLAGEPGVALAKAFGLSQQRVAFLLAAARGQKPQRRRAAAAAPVAAAAVPSRPEFRGNVTILPGTAAGLRPLTMSPQMRQAAERARAAQQPLRTLSSGWERLE